MPFSICELQNNAILVASQPYVGTVVQPGPLQVARPPRGANEESTAAVWISHTRKLSSPDSVIAGFRGQSLIAHCILPMRYNGGVILKYDFLYFAAVSITHGKL